MFGELIGLWLVETWRGLGAPPRLAILAEAGPGDGTLMADVLRAAQPRAGVLARRPSSGWSRRPRRCARRQAERLAGAAPRWAHSLAELPADAPLLLIANEFLDCLPARQFQRTARGWAERVVGLDESRRRWRSACGPTRRLTSRGRAARAR